MGVTSRILFVFNTAYSLFPAWSFQKASCLFPSTSLMCSIGNIIRFQSQNVQFHPHVPPNPFLPTVVFLPVARVKNLKFFFLDFSLPLPKPTSNPSANSVSSVFRKYPELDPWSSHLLFPWRMPQLELWPELKNLTLLPLLFAHPPLPAGHGQPPACNSVKRLPTQAFPWIPIGLKVKAGTIVKPFSFLYALRPPCLSLSPSEPGACTRLCRGMGSLCLPPGKCLPAWWL